MGTDTRGDCDAMANDLLSFIGLAGVVLYLGAYAALQLRLLSGHGTGYSMLNLFAASFVLIDLQRDFNLPSVLIQISWIAISLYGLHSIACRHSEPRPDHPPLPDPRMMRSYAYFDSLSEAATGHTRISERWSRRSA